MVEPGPVIDDDSVFVVPDDVGQLGPRVAGPAKQPRSIVRSLHRHKLTAVLMALLVVVIGAPVVYVRAIRPLYAAEAQILVSPIFPKNLIEDREYQVPRYEEFVNQQLARIVREDVVEAALDNLGENRALWVRPDEGRREAAIRLSGSLIAKRVPNTTYFSIGLEGRSPKGLAEVVNSVTQAYFAQVKDEIFYGQTTTMEALGRHRQALDDS